MAQVIEIKTVRGAEMMLRGKLGNQIFQVFLIRPKLPKIKENFWNIFDNF